MENRNAKCKPKDAEIGVFFDVKKALCFTNMTTIYQKPFILLGTPDFN